MELVVIVLNQTDALNEILSLFMEYKISGATVIDSSGMGHIISHQFPMFSMFAELNEEKQDNSKTIFTVVNSEEERNKVLAAVETVLGDINVANTAILFTIPVGFSKGTPNKEVVHK